MTVPTLLPIYTFGKVLGIHPLHLMQVDANIGTSASRVCVKPILQYSWQSADGVSREELAYAISAAEQEIADYLGYWPLPCWRADERQELVQNANWWFSSGYDVRGDRISTKTTYGQVISGGKVAKSIVSLGAGPIVYTDPDSDTYAEIATVTCATSVTDPEEIAVYYPGQAGNDEWEIRPITCSIVGGTATIVMRREQLVKLTLLESLDARAVQGTDNANFLTTVDVYRKYNDPSQQLDLVWRNNGEGWNYTGCSSCSDNSCESCTLTVQPGCLTVKDKALGLVTLSQATYDATTQTYGGSCSWSSGWCYRRPDYVRMWYRSGFRNMSLATPNITMSREWQRAVATLAISKLDREICSCKAVQDVQSHWNTDLRRNVGTRDKSQSLKVTNYELENCPFGTTIAGIEVWRLARRRSLGLDSGILT